MNKQLTLMLCGLFLSGAALAENRIGDDRPFLPHAVNVTEREVTVNGLRLDAPGLPSSKTELSTISESSNEVIVEAEGTTRYMVKNSSGYFVKNGSVTGYEGEFATTVVYGSENDVYIINPLTTLITDTYVRGTIEGNKIEVALPQTLIWENLGTANDPMWEGFELRVMKLEKVTGANGEEMLTYVVDEDKNSVYYTIDEDGGLTMENLGQVGMLGVVRKPGGEWIGYGDVSQSFTPYPRELVTLPEGIQLEDYSFVTATGGRIVKVGFDKDAAYFVDLVPYIPNGVIKADFKDGVASIVQDQFFGIYDNYFIITKCGNFERKGSKRIVLTEGSYDMTFDSETKEFRAVDPERLLIFNASEWEVNSFYYFQNLSIKYQDSMEGIPTPPTGLEFMDDKYSDQTFQFSISNVGANGNVLDFENLYYSIYLDDEILEFTSEDGCYPGIPEDEIWDEIPCSFINGDDIMGNGQTYRVIIYPEGITTVGVQLVYYCGKERTQSEIMTLNLETGKVTSSGVNEIIAGNPVSTTYFDLSGRKVAHPSGGIFVKRVIDEDGKVSVSKIICK